MPDEKALNFRFIIRFFSGLFILTFLMGSQKAFNQPTCPQIQNGLNLLSDRYNPHYLDRTYPVGDMNTETMAFGLLALLES